MPKSTGLNYRRKVLVDSNQTCVSTMLLASKSHDSSGLTRVIGHLDLDYFYAQVEEIEDRSLKNLPLVICVFSGRTETSGVVSTANYEAREMGVRSGIPITVAKKRLEGTGAKFIPMDRGKYETYSGRVMEIIKERVDTMEQTGIDETFFDITKKSGENYGAAISIAEDIKLAVFGQEKLTCSVGIAPNKVAAKLASDFKKPDGLTVISPEQLKTFMDPMPVEKLYGVGPKSALMLKELRVATIGELAAMNLESLERVFDRRLSVYLRNSARGLDDEPVVYNTEVKQISRIITLKQNSGHAQIVMEQFSPVIEDLHTKILDRGVFFRSVSVIGILTDLSIKTKSKTMEAPSNDLQSLKRVVTELLASLLGEGIELRRVGARVSDFSEARSQSSLSEYLGEF